MEPLENSHDREVHSMGKVVGQPWFLSYKNSGLGSSNASRIFLQSQEIIGKLILVLDIEFGDPDTPVLDSLYQQSQTAGLVESVVIEVLFLLRLVQAYNVSLFGTCISERNRYC